MGQYDDMMGRINDSRGDRRKTMAERRLIATLLQPGASDEARDRMMDLGQTHRLKPDDFTGDRQLVWKWMCKAVVKGRPMDSTLMVEELHGKVDIGEVLRMTREDRAAITSTTVWADEVSINSRRRKAAIALMEHAKSIMESDGFGLDSAINDAAMSLEVFARKPGDHGYVMEIEDTMMTAIDQAYERQRGEGKRCFPTGLRDLDNRLNGGYWSGERYAIMARPGGGKTCLGLQAVWETHTAGGVCYVASLEMSAARLGQRTLSAQTGVTGGRIKRGDFEQEECDRMVAAVDMFRESGGRTCVDATPGLTAQQIINRAERWKRKHGRLDILMIDYLQILGDIHHKQGQVTGLEMACHVLQMAAKSLDCALILLVQPNRKLESRPDKRPGTGDAKNCSTLEQFVDAIIGIYRPVLHGESDDSSKAEIGLPKNRDGAPGEYFEVIFNGGNSTFMSVEEGYSDGPLF